MITNQIKITLWARKTYWIIHPRDNLKANKLTTNRCSEMSSLNKRMTKEWSLTTAIKLSIKELEEAVRMKT